MNVSYYKFDIDDVTGELEANRPVPFRYNSQTNFVNLTLLDTLKYLNDFVTE